MVLLVNITPARRNERIREDSAKIQLRFRQSTGSCVLDIVKYSQIEVDFYRCIWKPTEKAD